MLGAAALATLPPRERAVVEMRFVDELTQSEIGVSQMQISRLLAKSLDQLRMWAPWDLDTPSVDMDDALVQIRVVAWRCRCRRSCGAPKRSCARHWTSPAGRAPGCGWWSPTATRPRSAEINPWRASGGETVVTRSGRDDLPNVGS
jgi:hypothetical protein